MEKHFSLTDPEFLKQFADCTLDPAVFSHEAHLRLAWIHIRESGLKDAITNIRDQLKQYVKKLGAEHKYNETVTVAAVKAVDHFMRRSSSGSFAEFLTEFPRLKYSFKELLAFHYKTDVFQDERAKKSYLEPELLPFD